MTTSINQWIKTGMYLFLVLFFASCSEIGEQSNPTANTSLKTIPEVLKSMDEGDLNQDSNARRNPGNTFATFNAALGKSGLAFVSPEMILPFSHLLMLHLLHWALIPATSVV